MSVLRWPVKVLLLAAITLAAVIASASAEQPARGTGDLGIVIERAAGSVQVVETTGKTVLGRIEGLGDLSHASAVYSRDGRYAFVFGRDGGLTKLDLLTMRIAKRIQQSGNSIGGAISQDGTLVAVSNYEPGGVKVFDSATLELVADIPATHAGGRSKVVGLVDAPGQLFVFGLWDAGEIWIADMSDRAVPKVTKFTDAGLNPYDGLITGDGRHYVAGLFGEDGLAKIDLWNLDAGVERILSGYGRGETKLPVYKMPHLEGVGAGGRRPVPAGGGASRAACGRCADLGGGRADRGARPARVCRCPPGRPSGLGEFCPPTERYGSGRRCAVAVGHRHPDARQGGFAPGVHTAWRTGLGVGPRRRSGRRLRHPVAGTRRRNCSRQAERHLSERACCAHWIVAMSDRLSPAERQLVNAYQRGFPLVPRPYQHVAESLGMTEAAVIAALEDLTQRGVLGRVGAVVAPNSVGASTLAALSAPEPRIEAVADLINSFEEVNHNYEREHSLNIWFVVTAPTRERIDAVLANIEHETGLPIFDFPLEVSYHIDLGFAL